MREKSWFREYGLILAAGVAVGIAALILSTLLTTLYLMTIIVRAYFPVGQLDTEALGAIRDPGRAMTVPLILLTVLGIAAALCSDPLIRFLQLVGSGRI